MARVEIEVGADLRSAAAEVAAAWKAAIANEPVQPSDKIVFIDWRTLCATLTSDRYDLLRTLHKAPAVDVFGLASMLGREIHMIEADIEALVVVGLVLRSDAGALSTTVDEIASTIRIAA